MNAKVRIEIALGVIKGQKSGRPGEHNSPDTIEAAVSGLLTRISGITGGATITRGKGGWLDGVGALVTEDSIIASTVCDNDAQTLRKLKLVAAYYKGWLQQDSVLFAVYPVTSVDFL